MHDCRVPLSFAVASRTIAAFDWSEQVFAVAISWMFKTAVRRVGLAALLGSLLLGGLHADWDFSQISRKSQALYGPLGAGQGRIDAWQNLMATQKQVEVMRASFPSFAIDPIRLARGEDLVAAEFRQRCADDPQWKALLSRPPVQCVELPGADHTCSSAQHRARVEDETLAFVRGLEGGASKR